MEPDEQLPTAPQPGSVVHPPGQEPVVEATSAYTPESTPSTDAPAKPAAYFPGISLESAGAVESKQSPPSQPAEESTATFSWEASEFVHHDKPPLWYPALALITVVLSAGLIFFHQWTSTAVVVVMAAAIFTYGRKTPRTLEYTASPTGITIGTRPEEPYAHFKSYSIQAEVAWHEFDLEPSRRFAQRLTIIAGADESAQIEAVLAQHLPMVPHEPDAIERFSKYIKF